MAEREMTTRAVAVGLGLSVLMVAVNIYLGLKTGITISGSIPCSVLALIVLGGLLGAPSRAELNLTQATGAIGEGIAGGVAFVFPALFLAGAFASPEQWGAWEYGVVTAAILSGSLAGVALASWLRKPMVEDSKDAKFPDAVATAELLKAGLITRNERHDHTKSLVLGVLVALIAKIVTSGVALLHDGVVWGRRIGSAVFSIGSDVSPALVGVGFILEFSGAAQIAAGSILSWLVLIPSFTALAPRAGPPNEIAMAVWREQVRYLAVGAMLVGAVMSVWQRRGVLLVALRSVLALGSSRSGNTELASSRRATLTLAVLAMISSIAVYGCSAGVATAATATACTIIALALLPVAAIQIAGLIGTTSLPVSGMTLCTLLPTGMVLLISGARDKEGVQTVLLVAGIVCLAAGISGNVAQSFKATQLLGGTPRHVQTGIVLAVVISALLSPLLIAKFVGRYGIAGFSPNGELKAPQATLFAKLAGGMFGSEEHVPWTIVAFGAGVGVLVVGLGAVLRRRWSAVKVSPMAFAVGMYLPLSTTLPILLGGLAQLLAMRRQASAANREDATRVGTVLCAGLVAGEAMAAALLMLPWSMQEALSLALLLAFPILILWRIGKRTDATREG